MKKFKNNEFLETALKMCVCAGLAFLFVLVVAHVFPSIAWCNDLFTKANTVLDTTKGKLVSFAMALFPVSLIVIILTLFFTKDERKIGLVVKAGVVVCLAAVLILLINKGIVLDTLKEWFGVDA